MNQLSCEFTKRRNVPPKAAAMVEALRGMGYTTASALADLVDNSISAGAAKVDVNFHWAGADSWISIVDNGRGMSDSELEGAMRIGELNPLDQRAENDLGRFGLGLKAASFSQARRLTVSSLKDGALSQLRWDLDFLAQDPTGEWALLEGAHPGSNSRCAVPGENKHGTVVLWEFLDRIITPSFREQDFLNLIDQVENHLGMVFHRYLDRTGAMIDLLINGRKVKPWDPFLSSHTSTWRSPEVPVGNSGRVIAQAFVLPHKDRLTEKEYIAAGGPDGWASQQGFSIYRNRRLLVSGTWLGLGRGRSWSKDEAHRLARIRLDISNGADSEWKIDIRKSSAQPPVVIREQLTRLAEDARDRARRVFLHRAQSNASVGRSGTLASVWKSEQLASGRRYRIDREHPAIKVLTDECGDLAKHVEGLLRVLEETIPVQRIWLEAAETAEHAKGGFAEDAEDSVKEVLLILYRSLLNRKSQSPEMARAQLMKTEPFDLYPALIAQLPDVLPKD